MEINKIEALDGHEVTTTRDEGLDKIRDTNSNINRCGKEQITRDLLGCSSRMGTSLLLSVG